MKDAWEIASYIVAAFFLGAALGISAMEHYTETTINEIIHANELCANNGGLKSFDANSTKCNDGAYFTTWPLGD